MTVTADKPAPIPGLLEEILKHYSDGTYTLRNGWVVYRIEHTCSACKGRIALRVTTTEDGRLIVCGRCGGIEADE